MQQTPDSGSKRDFLRYWLFGGVFAFLGTIFYPILAYLKPPKVTGVEVKNVDLGKTEKFAKNSGTNFRFGDQPGLLIRMKSGDFRAFNATCTHLQCTVQYKPDEGVIWCACHNGRYDLNGKNISGPPPRPLTPLKVLIQHDDVLVLKS